MKPQINPKFLVEHAPRAALEIVCACLDRGEESQTAITIIQAGLPSLCASSPAFVNEHGSLQDKLASLQAEKVESARPILRAWLSELDSAYLQKFFNERMRMSADMAFTFGIWSAREHLANNPVGSMIMNEAKAHGLKVSQLSETPEKLFNAIIRFEIHKLATNVFEDGFRPTQDNLETLLREVRTERNFKFLRTVVETSGVQAEDLRVALKNGPYFTQSLARKPELPGYIDALEAKEAIEASMRNPASIKPL